MVRGPFSTKILASFVLAFLCLNVSGAVCLSWCLQGFAPDSSASLNASEDSQLSEHCRNMKRQAEESNGDSSSIEAGQAACCMMPVAIFAAPVEKRLELPKIVTAEVKPATAISPPPAVIAYDRVNSQPVYRPPPRQLRETRLLNCVTRI